MEDEQISQMIKRLQALSSNLDVKALLKQATLSLPSDLSIAASPDGKSGPHAVENHLVYLALAKMINLGLQTGQLEADPIWLKLQMGLLDRAVSFDALKNVDRFKDLVEKSPDINKAISDAKSVSNKDVKNILKLSERWGKQRIAEGKEPKDAASVLTGLLAVYTQKLIDGHDQLLDRPNLLLSCLALASQLSNTAYAPQVKISATKTRH